MISYKGDPKLTKNNETNFFNPSCFVFPKENNCIPGDLFKKNQIKNLEKFLNYERFDFNISTSQKIFNYISLISFYFTIIFILYYSILKIFKKFKNVEGY